MRPFPRSVDGAGRKAPAPFHALDDTPTAAAPFTRRRFNVYSMRPGHAVGNDDYLRIAVVYSSSTAQR
jgi:hypothetical protein